jgi:hypothetical protein
MNLKTIYLDQDDLDMFEGDDSFEDFGFERIGIK